MLIAQVTSSDGVSLYCPVQANPVSFYETQRQLREVAIKRTAADLLADAYYSNPGCAKLQLPCAECRAKVAA